MNLLAKLLLSMSLAIGLGAAAAPPADVQTGRSVAVDQPQRYWLSDGLNRVFLQKHDSRDPAGTETPNR